MPSLCDCSEAEALLRVRAGGRLECTSACVNTEQGCSARRTLDIMGHDAALVKDIKEGNREGRLRDSSGGTCGRATRNFNHEAAL